MPKADEGSFCRAGALAVLIAALFAGCSRETPAPPPPARTETAVPEAQADPKCVAAPRVLCPVDEGDSDPSFAAFRAEVLDALRKRDKERLLTFVDPKIRTSFGDGGGIDELRKSLDDLSWGELEQLLTLGGSFREGMFWAPYVYSNWPESIDAFQHVAAIRFGVPVRNAPSDGAPEVANVDYAILELLPATETPGWRRVRTPDGKEGWVSAKDVRSPIGYRLGFSKRSGTWKMEAFVAGD